MTGSLRADALSGAFWNISLAVVNKVITTGGQVALTWFLMPQDMGLVAMAASVIAIATLFTASGMDDLLVQRHEHYEKDAPQVLWISLGFNLLALAIVICLMPFARRHFGDPRIGLLMLIQAASWPISTLSLVLVPKLRNQLRFKALAIINLGEGALFTGTAVLLAYFGCGPYALAWPIFVRVIFAALACWWTAGKPSFEAPRPRSWPQYLGPGLLLMLGNFVSNMATQLPVFIIGSYLDARRTGLYSWGFLLALQAVFLLAINLRGLFTPLFSKLNMQPERRAEAIARSLHVITAIVIPVCLIQAFLARPLVLLFFPARWADAAPVVSLLSLGLMLQPVAIITHAALIARGQYGGFVLISLIQALAVGAGAFIGCQGGELANAALGAAVAMLACLPVYFWVLRRMMGGPWRRLWGPSKPFLFSLAAALPAYAVTKLGGSGQNLAWNGSGVAVFLLLLLALSFFFDSGLVNQIKGIRLRPAMAGAVIFMLAIVGPLRSAVIFDATTGYRNKPDAEPAGIQRLVLANHEAFWPDAKPGQKAAAWPESIDENAEKRLAEHATAWDEAGLDWVCFDIEHLKPVEDPAACNAFLIRCAAIVRRSAPGIRLGFYGLPPIRDLNRSLLPPQSAGFEFWQRQNDALAPAVLAMDAVFPSLYTFTENENEWRTRAQSFLAEARRYGRPVYPFLWPRYHESNPSLGLRLVKSAFWKRQLAFSLSQADGLVVWNYGKKAAWKDSAPWWRAVKVLAAGQAPLKPAP